LAQFEDFAAFMLAIEPYGHEAGIVKIIPPQEWTGSLPNIEPRLKQVRIRKPIIQEINGGGLPAGAYFQMNIEQRKTYSVQDWFDYCSSPVYKPPLFDENGKAIFEQCGPKENTPINFDIVKSSERFSPEYCADLERFYWRNITYVSPVYGADMLGSLFDDQEVEEDSNGWNLARLDNLLNRVNVFLPGVNSPYLYFGMWKATFAWHLEDMDLYSINYIHFGAPKQWYVVPPAHRQRFEALAKSIFSDEASNCPEFLRHKTCILSPKILANHSIPMHRLVQHAGEFVVTFPYGYHQGYNLGFNCAESVNFALDSWVTVGKKASYCHCISDSVKLDVAGIFDPQPE
ncbi:JmjC domain, hydroxylase-domain-containing protein, partial [Blyttiomyces helicus]